MFRIGLSRTASRAATMMLALAAVTILAGTSRAEIDGHELSGDRQLRP